MACGLNVLILNHVGVSVSLSDMAGTFKLLTVLPDPSVQLRGKTSHFANQTALQRKLLAVLAAMKYLSMVLWKKKPYSHGGLLPALCTAVSAVASRMSSLQVWIKF